MVYSSELSLVLSYLTIFPSVLIVTCLMSEVCVWMWIYSLTKSFHRTNGRTWGFTREGVGFT